MALRTSARASCGLARTGIARGSFGECLKDAGHGGLGQDDDVRLRHRLPQGGHHETVMQRGVTREERRQRSVHHAQAHLDGPAAPRRRGLQELPRRLQGRGRRGHDRDAAADAHGLRGHGVVDGEEGDGGPVPDARHGPRDGRAGHEERRRADGLGHADVVEEVLIVLRVVLAALLDALQHGLVQDVQHPHAGQLVRAPRREGPDQARDRVQQHERGGHGASGCVAGRPS